MKHMKSAHSFLWLQSSGENDVVTALDGGLSLTACWLMGCEDPQAVVAEATLCSGS